MFFSLAWPQLVGSLGFGSRSRHHSGCTISPHRKFGLNSITAGYRVTGVVGSILLKYINSTSSATDHDSFLGVDEYVVHLYDKYGEGGGMLSKKAFAQVINVPPCSLHTAWAAS